MICNVELDNHTDCKVENLQSFIEEVLNFMEYPEDTELSLVFCDNSFIRSLNKNYREKDYATDVLSFPADLGMFLGDIVISLEKAKEQAEGTFTEELEMLLVHGVLHLLGYDHELGEQEYEEMMGLQKKILKNKTERLTIKWD